MTDAPRKPDFTIRAIRKGTQMKGEIGVAWKNEDGSIFMKFNPFVTVPVGDDFAITAFLIDSSEGRRTTRRTYVSSNPRNNDLDDEIPF